MRTAAGSRQQPSGPRRRPCGRRGAAVISAITSLVIAGCSAAASSRAPQTRSPVAASTAASPSASPTPYPQSVTSEGMLRLGGGPGELVPAGDALYALGLLGSTALRPPASDTVVRIDVARQREAARTVLPRPVVSGSISTGGLYVVLSDTGSGKTSPAGLVRLDATTLRIRAQATLAVEEPSVVARPEAVYVLDGTRLERRDPVTLLVTASLELPRPPSTGCPQQGGALAADPRSHTGWAAVTQESGGFRVAEIDLSRLSLLHVSEETGGMCGSRASAMLDGVWAGFATGLLSDAVRLASATGEVDARLHPADADRFQQPNSAVYQVSATALWVYGGRSLSCADPHTGLVLASTDVGDPSGAVAMVADVSHVFISVPDGIAVYAPTGRCAQ
jgi:hypothetical protein